MIRAGKQLYLTYLTRI